MSKQTLLIDFGASRIKSACLLSTEVTPESNHNSDGSGKIGKACPARFFAEALVEHLGVAEKLAPVNKIIMCSEMHGFAECDPLTGTPGQYFSWRYSAVGDRDHIIKLNDGGFFDKTGMRAKSGLPIVNIMAMRSLGRDGRQPINIAFIPDAICRLLGESYNQVHASLAHASGLYTIDNKPLTEFGLPPLTCPMSSDRDDVCIGTVKFKGREIPLFGGFGDLQASVLGVQPLNNQWIINLGTGSQIISLIPTDSDQFEQRAYFDQKMINCISHIPAGRALNIFANFFGQIRGEATPDYFWQLMKNLKKIDEIDELPQFNLKTFPQAFNFSDGGSITNINEKHFHLDDFCLGLVNSFVDQYIQLIKPENPTLDRPIILAGNLCYSVPLIAKFFEKKWNSKITKAKSNIEPSLEGLALKFKKHHP